MTKAEIAREYALSKVGCPYVFATSGKICTPSLRKERAATKPTYAANIKKYCPVLSGSKSTCAGCAYQGKEAFDCRGLTYKAAVAAGLTLSSIGASSQWKGDYWQEKGRIADMPTDKVCFVFRESASASPMSHTGVYIGDGTVVEARGHKAGVIRSTLESYNWTHYAILRGMYDGAEGGGGTGDTATPTIAPTVRKGSKGQAVTTLQTSLVALGYNIGTFGANGDGIDGDFGAKTLEAVIAFQADRGLTVDGIVGTETWDALIRADKEQPDETEVTDEKRFRVIIENLDAAEATHLLESYQGATSEEMEE